MCGEDATTWMMQVLQRDDSEVGDEHWTISGGYLRTQRAGLWCPALDCDGVAFR